MKKEVKIIKKVKHLLKRLGCPRWLHHFGPKIYEFYEHLMPLLVRHFCKGLSYRKIVSLFDLFGFNCPSKSALQYTAKKIEVDLWNRILELTSGIRHHIIALDGTGFSVANPSYHYLRRIDGKIPKNYVELSASFDTKLKKWCSAKVRIIPRHDIKDTKELITNINARIIVADKAYDAEWLHKFCIEKGMQTCIPIRDYGKVRCRNTLRRRLAKNIKQKTYGRRNMIEAGFSSLKRKFGSSVNSKTARTIRAEIYGKMICHNLFSYFIRVLGQSLCYSPSFIAFYTFKKSCFRFISTSCL